MANCIGWPYRKLLDFPEFSGATRRIRTDDLLITNQLLYQAELTAHQRLG